MKATVNDEDLPKIRDLMAMMKDVNLVNVKKCNGYQISMYFMNNNSIVYIYCTYSKLCIFQIMYVKN